MIDQTAKKGQLTNQLSPPPTHLAHLPQFSVTTYTTTVTTDYGYDYNYVSPPSSYTHTPHPLPFLDPGLLTVGQYAWMEHDLFLLAVRPLFLSYGLSEFRVKILIEDAQQDLYYPLIRPYSCVHVSHARKVPSWTAPRRRTHRVR